MNTRSKQAIKPKRRDWLLVGYLLSSYDLARWLSNCCTSTIWYATQRKELLIDQTMEIAIATVFDSWQSTTSTTWQLSLVRGIFYFVFLKSPTYFTHIRGLWRRLNCWETTMKAMVWFIPSKLEAYKASLWSVEALIAFFFWRRRNSVDLFQNSKQRLTTT